MRPRLLILIVGLFFAPPFLFAEEKPLELGPRYFDIEAECSFCPPAGWERAKPKGRSGIVYVGPQRGEIILRFGISVSPRPTGNVSGTDAPLGDMKARFLAQPIRLSEATLHREEYRVLRKTDMLLFWFERPEKAEDAAKLYEALRKGIQDWSTLIDRTRFSFRIPGPGWAEGFQFPEEYKVLEKEKRPGVEGVEEAYIHHEKHPAILRMIHVTTAADKQLDLAQLTDMYVKTVADDGVVVEKDRAKKRRVSGAEALVTPVRREIEEDGKKVVTRRGIVVVVRQRLSFFVLVAVDYTGKLPDAALAGAVDAVLESTVLKKFKR